MSRGRNQPKLRVLTEAQLDALLAKLRAPEASLDGPDRSNLAGIVESFAHVIDLVVSGRTAELHRLLGISRSRGAESGTNRAAEGTGEGEPPSAPAPAEVAAPSAALAAVAAPDEDEKRRDEHGRRGPDAFKKLAHEHHAHRQLKVGDACPECARGRLYRHPPDEFTIVTGQSPLVATRHTVDCLRCSLCKSVFKAPLPEPLLADGVEIRPLYSYSAVAMVVFYRFFAGLPMHRKTSCREPSAYRCRTRRSGTCASASLMWLAQWFVSFIGSPPMPSCSSATTPAPRSWTLAGR